MKQRQGKRRCVDPTVVTDGDEVVDLTLPHQLRLLEDTDIAKILDCLGPAASKIGKAEAVLLKERVNIYVEIINDERRIHHKLLTSPHKQVKEMQALQASLDRSLELLRKNRDRLVDAYLANSTASPAAEIEIPWFDIYETIKEVQYLRDLAAVWEAKQRRLQNRSRKRDYQRYKFVSYLAFLFHRGLGFKLSNYLDGPWCVFLSSVLTICERKEIDRNGARHLWREVRKSRSDRWDFLVCAELAIICQTFEH